MYLLALFAFIILLMLGSIPFINTQDTKERKR